MFNFHTFCVHCMCFLDATKCLGFLLFMCFHVPVLVKERLWVCKCVMINEWSTVSISGLLCTFCWSISGCWAETKYSIGFSCYIIKEVCACSHTSVLPVYLQYALQYCNIVFSSLGDFMQLQWAFTCHWDHPILWWLSSMGCNLYYSITMFSCWHSSNLNKQLKSMLMCLLYTGRYICL